MTVDILGTAYSVQRVKRKDDEFLNDCDGYCDKTTKRIVVADLDRSESSLGDMEWYIKKCLRHEIVHAFMYESGLAENWEHKTWGQEETTVDWIASQGLKIYQAWEVAEAV